MKDATTDLGVAYSLGEQMQQLLKGTPVGQMSYIVGGRTQCKSYFENCFVENKDKSLGYCFDIECDSSFIGCSWDELADMFPSYVYKMSKGKQPRLIRIKQSI